MLIKILHYIFYCSVVILGNEEQIKIQMDGLEPIEGTLDIAFKDVYFGYDDYSVINGVSVVAKQSGVTALIGPPGSGKTTLTRLVARFWTIDKGQILLGGEDTRKRF